MGEQSGAAAEDKRVESESVEEERVETKCRVLLCGNREKVSAIDAVS